MKKKLIILDIFLILLVGIVGFGLFKNFERHHGELSILNYQEAGATREILVDERNHPLDLEEHQLKIDVGKIKTRDFTSLVGMWKNIEQLEEGVALMISNGKAIFDEEEYELALSEQNMSNQWSCLSLKKEGRAAQVSFAIYPERVAIPVMKPDGAIDTTGAHDPTDFERDRLVLGQGVLNAETLKKQVLYRENI